MDPTVVAAWIAAGVSVLTLVGTLAAQYLGYRAASRDAEKTAEEQRQQAAEQRAYLEQTLKEQRTTSLNERFATAAEQLGSDKPPAVRLAGVYAMAGLADDWEENRQTCVDVLCAYLRIPYESDPGQRAPELQRLAFQSSREVRHTVIRVITAHLQSNATVSWQDLNFDLTGVVFDGGDFSGAQFSCGSFNFRNAQFSSGTVHFGHTRFSGGRVRFNGAEFSGGEVWFSGEFSRGNVNFSDARFSGSSVHFGHTRFSGGSVNFIDARFSSGAVYFSHAQFAGGEVRFDGAEFSGGTVSFARAEFSDDGVYFDGAEFSGGTVDFTDPGDWSTPPNFPWADTPPTGVKLPDTGGKAN